jgi:hypothetical protein
MLLEGLHWVTIVKIPIDQEIGSRSTCMWLTPVAWLLQNNGFFNTTLEWEQAWDRHHKQMDDLRQQPLQAAAGPSSNLQVIHHDIPEFSGPQHQPDDFEDCLYEFP